MKVIKQLRAAFAGRSRRGHNASHINDEESFQASFDPITQKQLTKRQNFTAPMVACNMLGQPVWTPRNYRALSQEGYARNVIVHRCVNLIARGCASIPWLFFEDGIPLEDHPLKALLMQTSPKVSFQQFLESVVANLLLAGNSYIEAINDERSGEVQELYVLRPDRVKVIPDRLGHVAAYEYEVDGLKRRINAHLKDGQISLLHLKSFNPLNDWYGQSPLEAAACSIDQHNAVAAHNLSLLQNGGRPTGAMIVNRNSASRASVEEVQELKADLRSIIEGERNAGRVLLLEGDFEWREMGLSPRDLDFTEGKNTSAREIAQAFNVPSMLVGIPGDATYANFKEARCHLWEDTIIPLAHHVKQKITNWLSPSYQESNERNSGLTIELDLDRVAALSPKREETWRRLSECTFLTKNEKRKSMGYAPIAGGDTL